MNQRNRNGWGSVGPHSDFEPRRTPPQPYRAQMFLRGLIDGKLSRIDDFLKEGDVARARALIEGWSKQLRTGEWP